jgi:ppGpp synthetase/RelA/SpoT-type nucleotidyltranferase
VRLWAKLHQPKYRDRVKTFDEIVEVIDDMVGVRVICTNKSDVEKIRRVLSTWTRLPKDATTADHGLVVEQDSERDYLANAKDSWLQGVAPEPDDKRRQSGRLGQRQRRTASTDAASGWLG